MNKYNIAICCCDDNNIFELDILTDLYELRYINYERINNYDCYNYIILEKYIIEFIKNLSEDFFIKHVFDDINFIINLNKEKKTRVDIYRNKYIDTSFYPFKKLSKLEKEILFLCKQIENFYFS
jgi:hypothetical protein